MAKTTEEIFEQLESAGKPGLMDTIREIGGQIWDAAAPAASLGADEVARFLNTGAAYTYHGSSFPEEGQGQSHGLPVEAQKIEPLQQEQERGGMEM